jgi:1-acyl-sn-glycerol-3-phosphate acyltransferase
MYILRVLIIISIFIIYIILGTLLNIDIFLKYSQNIKKKFIYMFGFKKIHISEKGLNRYNKLLKSNKKCILVYNHRSIFDGIIICSVFKKIKAFMNSKITNMFPYLSNVLKKSGYLLTNDNMTNKTKLITNFVNQRKENEGILSIAPDGLKKIGPTEAIAPFKSGAFVDKFCILPVVIKYKNYTINPENKDDNHILNLFQKPLDLNCEVILDVMKLIKPPKEISIDEYKRLVHKQMSNRYNEL